MSAANESASAHLMSAAAVSAISCISSGVIALGASAKSSRCTLAYMLCLSLFLCGCASNPNGSNWALADFNKYDLNYAPFPTDRLQIGMPKSEVQAMFGANMNRISAEPTGETYVVDKLKSVAGPDYVEERLVMRFDRDRLATWTIEKANIVTVAPRTF